MLNRFFFALLALLALAGCDSLLDEEPRSVIDPDQFYNTVEEAEAAVNGVYSNLYDEYMYGQEYYNVSFTGTDVAFLDRPDVAVAHYFYTLSVSNPERSPRIWLGLYEAITTANQVIARVEASNIAEDARARIVGEAKFLRAHYYFQLTQYWGGVPLWTDELDLDEVESLARSSREEVRAQIISDLEDAVAGIPPASEVADEGRATQGAAQLLLAKVHLYEENWAQARDHAQQVIDSGEYTLLQNYAEVFGVENENNDEIVFSVQFLQDVRYDDRHSWYEPESSEYEPAEGDNVPSLNGYGLFLPTQWFVESFEEGDERRDVVLADSYNGQAFSRTYFGPKYWELEAPLSNSGTNFNVLRFSEAYLIAAEAENELNGPTAAAYENLNRVRERAELDPLDGLSQDEFLEAVKMERAHELAGEGERRWDLNRWGDLIEAVQKVEGDNPRGAENIRPYHTLYPIPPTEINKNPELTQNPGYSG